MPTLRYGAWLNGYTELALMKLDVLSGLPEIRVCTGYELNGEVHDTPLLTADMEQVQPVYQTLPGWQEDIDDVSSYDDLPANARAFVEFVEQRVGVPIAYVSVGPDRKQTLVR
ncbi:hypothetical protein GCM10025857_30450 [Alicyclobacillus contaminans]|nr:hypothetical protein GCM10025857_30450 [Alicyclobacillus contaminans]